MRDVGERVLLPLSRTSRLMVEAPNATDRRPHERWQFSLRGLFLLSFSVALGLSFWKMEQDWYLGALAAISFWIVLGLAAQIRDIWRAFRLDVHATTDERWGWRFAIVWRLAICLLIGVCFLIRSLRGLHAIAMNDGSDFLFASSVQIWDAVLLISIAAAVSGSLGLARRTWRRPWSWAIYIFRGFVAGYFLLVLLEDLQGVPYLVHITIVGILSAQPLQFESDVVMAASRTRTDQCYGITTAGAISLLVSCILLWQLSVRWRASGWQRMCVGAMLAASLTVMGLLTARIVVVEIPTISPIMTANIRVPTSLQLGAAILLVMLLATAIARRWSEPPLAETAAGRMAWRRDERRYYHERCALLLFLGSIALAKCIALGQDVYPWLSGWSDILYFFYLPEASLSLVLVLLAVQVVVSRWRKRSDAIAAEQPRLTPTLFVTLWFAILAIIVCSAPILSAWRFAAFLRSGYYP